MDELSTNPGTGKPTTGTQQKRRSTGSRSSFNDLVDHGKIPPQATDIEEAVLGALMIEPNALTAVIDILRTEVFYRPAHQRIFTAIYNLFGRSETVDLLTVTNELRKMGELDLAGGAPFISQLTNRVASAANIEYHSRILLEKFIQRELIRISGDIIKEAYEDTTDVFDLLDKAESNLFSVSESNLRRESVGMQTLVKEAIHQIHEAIKHEGHVSGIPSGFTEIDRVTAGWQKSDLIILAARPGMGKTAFVLSMARNIAVDWKKPVAVFSLEMSALQLVTRLIASETELPTEKLKKGDLADYELQQLNNKVAGLISANLFIDDTPALSIFELRAKCRRLKQQHNIEMVVVDYLQLMQASSDHKGNRENEISTISRSLKALAKELNIPVICLSQLNRAVETRTGTKRPVLSDLRESGAIEQDADMVLFIYRPEYYKLNEYEDGSSTQGLAEIIIAKHRNGPLANIKLKFVDRFAKFTDYTDQSFMLPDSLPGIGDEGGTKTLPSRMNNEPEEGADEEVPY